MQGLNAPVVLASGSRLGACRGCSRESHARAPQICRRLRVTVRAESSSEKMRMAQQEMRDFGARDPTTAELDFNFQERVLFNASTEHVIMIPSSARKYLGLASKSITPSPPGTKPLEFKDAELRRKQVLDWKFVEDSGSLRLRRNWLVKDEAAGKTLAARVQEVATEEGYAAAVHVSQAGEQITVDVSSPGLDGVTDNDFILAAKVDSLDLADLVKPARRRTQFY